MKRISATDQDATWSKASEKEKFHNNDRQQTDRSINQRPHSPSAVAKKLK